MRSDSGLPLYPKRRQIVFAGVNTEIKYKALLRCKVESILATFFDLKTKKPGVGSHASMFDYLDQWPQYRYLDSGAFTFKARALVRNLSSGKTKKEIESKKRQGDRTQVYLKEVMDYFQLYYAYLEQNLDRWDFVIDFDLDGVPLLRDEGPPMPGYEVTLYCREKLKALAGPKFLPAWHLMTDDPTTFNNLHEMCKEYRYITIGTARTLRHMRYICDIAHDAGVMVHGLGTSSADVLQEVPYDTADSTSWLAAGKFGNYGELLYTTQRKMSRTDLAKVKAFEERVRSLGIDPATLVGDKPDGVAQLVVSATLMMDRMAALPPIPTPIFHPTLPLAAADTNPADDDDTEDLDW